LARLWNIQAKDIEGDTIVDGLSQSPSEPDDRKEPHAPLNGIFRLVRVDQFFFAFFASLALLAVKNLLFPAESPQPFRLSLWRKESGRRPPEVLNSRHPSTPPS
jgi:hypothetical protein